MQKVKDEVLQTANVKGFDHIHVWAISTTQNALTGHLVVSNHLTMEQIKELKRKVKHKLEHVNIHHCTIETEAEVQNS